MADPDFYVPYAGGHLPMGIVQLTVSNDGASGGPHQIRMTIEAVSVGAPIFVEPPTHAVIREVGS